MIAAFSYRDYYCYGIKNSFRGLYNTEEEALSVIRGGGGDENLELMDLETAGIKKYRWLPLYEENATNVLTHRWDKTKPEIILEWDGPVRKYGHNNIYYEAGDWTRET
jgi:hypothetical protein